MRRKGFNRPDIGDDIDERTADFCRTIGISAMTRCAALSEKRKGTCRNQHKETKGGDQTPPDGREDDQCRTEIGADRSNIEQNNRQDLLYRISRRRDAVGERAAQYVREIAAGMTT